jgi:hypothetical protein
MKTLAFVFSICKIYIFLFFVSFYALAETLELEDTSLHGKKDQPEAMTFISRAKMTVSPRAYDFNGYEKIYEELKDDVFNLKVKNSGVYFNNR